MIEQIKTFLDAQSDITALAEKITYKKPIQEKQPDTYLYFVSTSKVRIKS